MRQDSLVWKGEHILDSLIEREQEAYSSSFLGCFFFLLSPTSFPSLPKYHPGIFPLLLTSQTKHLFLLTAWMFSPIPCCKTIPASAANRNASVRHHLSSQITICICHSVVSFGWWTHLVIDIFIFILNQWNKKFHLTKPASEHFCPLKQWWRLFQQPIWLTFPVKKKEKRSLMKWKLLLWKVYHLRALVWQQSTGLLMRCCLLLSRFNPTLQAPNVEGTPLHDSRRYNRPDGVVPTG